jgi:hypothetical protein
MLVHPEELLGGLSFPIGATHSNKSPQQAADALKDAAQQPEDAGQEPTYCTAEAAKNSHLRLLFELRRFPYPGHRTGLPQMRRYVI